MNNKRMIDLEIQLESATEVALTENISGMLKAIDETMQGASAAMCMEFSAVNKSIEHMTSEMGKLTDVLTTVAERLYEAINSVNSSDLLGSGLGNISSGLGILSSAMTIEWGTIQTAIKEALGVIVTAFSGSGATIVVVLGVIAAAMGGIIAISSEMSDGVLINLEGLKQHVASFGKSVSELWTVLYNNIFGPILTNIGGRMDGLWENHLKPMWDKLNEFITTTGSDMLALWDKTLRPFIEYLSATFGGFIVVLVTETVDQIVIGISVVSDIVGAIIQQLQGFRTFITGVFTLDIEKAWSGIKKTWEGRFNATSAALKAFINVIIYFINGFVGRLYSCMAGVFNRISGIIGKIAELTGQKWDLSAPTALPQIPYLAQGAVLPANKPFLAMVGDQKHGTNVEAPLATIQEAVALVMEDMVASNMAGHEATVAALRQILQAVMGIRVGDEVLGRAVDRYHSKMAVIHGGM